MRLDLRPDSFEKDPYGWATNQLSHGVLGMAGAVLAEILTGSIWATLAVAPLYFLIVEVMLQKLAMPLDSLADTAHVAVGSFILPAYLVSPLHAAALFVAWGLFLAIGYARRARRDRA